MARDPFRSRQLEGLVFHGAPQEAVTSIKKRGLQSSSDGWIGSGVYTADDPAYAAMYATRGKTQTGVVLGLRPKGSPLRTWDGESTYAPDQLSIVNVQRVNRTSLFRANLRQSGVPPLPKTGPVVQPPIPVTQLPKSEIKRRLTAERNPRSVFQEQGSSNREAERRLPVM